VRRGQRLEIQEQRGSVQFVENRVDERDDQAAQLFIRRGVAVLGFFEQREQAVQRVLVARQQNFFLVPVVVVQIAFLHFQRGGNLFDGGAVIPEPPEGNRRALQDFYARRGVVGGASFCRL